VRPTIVKKVDYDYVSHIADFAILHSIAVKCVTEIASVRSRYMNDTLVLVK
jgi:hypothetical protein